MKMRHVFLLPLFSLLYFSSCQEEPFELNSTCSISGTLFVPSMQSTVPFEYGYVVFDQNDGAIHFVSSPDFQISQISSISWGNPNQECQISNPSFTQVEPGVYQVNVPSQFFMECTGFIGQEFFWELEVPCPQEEKFCLGKLYDGVVAVSPLENGQVITFFEEGKFIFNPSENLVRLNTNVEVKDILLYDILDQISCTYENIDWEKTSAVSYDWSPPEDFWDCFDGVTTFHYQFTSCVKNIPTVDLSSDYD